MHAFIALHRTRTGTWRLAKIDGLCFETAVDSVLNTCLLSLAAHFIDRVTGLSVPLQCEVLLGVCWVRLGHFSQQAHMKKHLAYTSTTRCQVSFVYKSLCILFDVIYEVIICKED